MLLVFIKWICVITFWIIAHFRRLKDGRFENMLFRKSYFDYLMCFVITFSLTFWYVVVHQDNIFCVEKILILASMGPKVHSKFWLIFRKELRVTRKMCHGGRGLNLLIIWVAYFFEWPIITARISVRRGESK